MDPKRFKHTALDDDSDFYKKPEKKTEKQKWHDMNRRQRWQYFKDYYLLKVIIAIIAAAVIIRIVVIVTDPGQRTILQVAVWDDDLDDDMVRACEDELQDNFTEEGQEGSVSIDDNYPGGSSEANVKLTVYLQAASLDVVIAPEEKFRELAAYGTFADLEDIFTQDELEKFGSLLMTFEVGGTGTEEISSEEASGDTGASETAGSEAGTEESQTEYVVCGIDLSGSEKYNYLQPSVKNPVLGIVANSKHTDLSCEFAQYLLTSVSSEETSQEGTEPGQ